MGNFISCIPINPSSKKSKSARVIFPGGELRRLCEPIKAAELMFECPNFFLVNSVLLDVGQRFSVLTADEEIELGNLYVMFPMKRLNSVVVAGDLAFLLTAANSAAKRRNGGKMRVLPESDSCGEEMAATGRL